MSTPNPLNQQIKLSEVLAVINDIAEKAAEGNYIYRGEPECYCEVSSGLYRVYPGIQQEGIDIAVIQEEILERAQEYTVPAMDEFELLATLQHFGDKTNLIDFTTDYLVALFFASNSESNKDGRVILLPRQSKSYEVKKTPRTIRRAEVQKSIFVRARKGVVKPDEDKVVRVPADLKEAILGYLGKYHDISTKTIYNDLQGFIEKRDIHGDAYTEFYRGLACRRSIASAETPAKEKELNEAAIRHYTEAIKLKLNLFGVYNSRGLAYADNGRYDLAIQDYDTAIYLNPEYAEAYNSRGLAHADNGRYDLAIQDYDTAIDLNPEYAEAYNSRGNFYSLNDEHARAIQDYKTAIDLNDEYAEAYANRGIVFLHLKEWGMAEADLKAAKDRDFDIVAAFKKLYDTVENFEEKNFKKDNNNRVKVPKLIADMLQ